MKSCNRYEILETSNITYCTNFLRQSHWMQSCCGFHVGVHLLFSTVYSIFKLICICIYISYISITNTQPKKWRKYTLPLKRMTIHVLYGTGGRSCSIMTQRRITTIHSTNIYIWLPVHNGIRHRCNSAMMSQWKVTKQSLLPYEPNFLFMKKSQSCTGAGGGAYFR